MIKDQNALDAYVLIEGYLNLLIERTSLLEQERFNLLIKDSLFCFGWTILVGLI